MRADAVDRRDIPAYHRYTLDIGIYAGICDFDVHQLAGRGECHRSALNALTRTDKYTVQLFFLCRLKNCQ